MIDYYQEMDFTEMYKKNRKSYIEHLKELETEQIKRFKQIND